MNESTTMFDVPADDPGFVDDVTPAAGEPIIIDRSTLEHWAECPSQAAAIDRKLVSNGGFDADVGSESHRILSAAVKARVEGAHVRSVRELIDEGARASRPDLQPAVVEALRRSYPITEFLTTHEATGAERHPSDILKHDGGDGALSGQISAELLFLPAGSPRILLTGEVDLLLATDSEEELLLIDFKSGWKSWNATAVKQSFQFSFYCWLLFRIYCKVRSIRVSVWLTREGYLTPAATFKATDYAEIDGRLRAAALIYLEHRNKPLAEIPAWPNPDKCSICPAVTKCTEAHRPERDFAADPEAYFRQYVAVTAAGDKMKGVLTAARRERGSDFVFGDLAFGTDKPKSSRAPTCDLYKIAPTKPAPIEAKPVTPTSPGAAPAAVAGNEAAAPVEPAKTSRAPRKRKAATSPDVVPPPTSPASPEVALTAAASVAE